MHFYHFLYSISLFVGYSTRIVPGSLWSGVTVKQVTVRHCMLAIDATANFVASRSSRR